MFILRLFFILLAISCSCSISAQTVLENHDIGIKQWLAERKVYAAARDSAGYFYVFTDHRIQRWDGKQFINIEHPDIGKTWEFDRIIKKVRTNHRGEIEIFPINSVNYFWRIPLGGTELIKIVVSKTVQWFPSQFQCLAVDPITEQVLKFQGGELKLAFDLDLVNGLPDQIILTKSGALLQMEGGDIWEKKGQVTKALEISNCTLGQTIQGDIYAISPDLIFKWEDTALVALHRFEKKQSQVVFVRGDELGNLLIARTSVVRKVHDISVLDREGELTPMNAAIEINDKIIDIVSDDFFSDWFVASYTGINIYKYKQPGLESFHVNPNVEIGSFGRVIPSVIPLPDRKGVLFFEETFGAFQYHTEYGLDSLATSHPLLKEDFRSNQKIIESEPGKYWMYHFTYENFTKLNLFDYQNISIERHTIPFKLSDLIKLDSQTLLLAGYDTEKRGHLSLYNPKTRYLSSISEGTKIADKRVAILFHDQVSRKLYAGGKKGLFVLDENYKLIHHFDDTPTSEIRLANIYIRSIIRRGQFLYVGTNGGGLHVIDPEKNKLIHVFNANNGLSENIPVAMEIDQFENLWVGTYNGINVIDTSLNVIRTFYDHQGIPAREFNTKASAKLPNGNLFFGTINGLSMIEPATVLSPNTSEGLSISKVLAHYGNNIQELNRNEDQFQLYRSCDSIQLFLDFPDYYQYPNISNSLEAKVNVSGFDNIRFHSDHLTFSNPKHGRKSILIQAKESGRKVHFNYQLNWDLNWLLKLLVGCSALLGAVILFVRYVVKRKLDQETEQAIINQKISELELNALRSQMNPHFIFNALGSVQYFIQENDKEKADEYLSDFAQLMRLILESSKSAMIPLDEEIKLLTLYLGLEKMRFSDKFNFKLSLDEEIDLNVEIPPMIIQPFLENAINHGIYHLNNREGKIDLRIFNQGLDLICEIEDNGIGRTASKSFRRKNHKSRGTQILDERIQTLNKLKTVGLQVNTIDLIVDNKAVGTKVVVKFENLND